MSKFNHLEIFFAGIIAISSAITAGIGFYGYKFIKAQLEQANRFKQFDNYNSFNKVYADWYHDMPDFLKNCTETKVNWGKLKNGERAWIRRYFNLYADEYYFSLQKMIPQEMWDELIHGKEGCTGAAIVNLKEYPILLDGYKKWKEEGAFNYPSDFTDMLDAKIDECKDMLRNGKKQCSITIKD